MSECGLTLQFIDNVFKTHVLLIPSFYMFQTLESPALYEVISVVRGETEYLTLEQVRDKLSSIETVQVV